MFKAFRVVLMAVSTSYNVNVSLTARCERDGDIFQHSRKQRQGNIRLVSPAQSGCQHHATGRITEGLTPKTTHKSHRVFVYMTFLLTFSH